MVPTSGWRSGYYSLCSRGDGTSFLGPLVRLAYLAPVALGIQLLLIKGAFVPKEVLLFGLSLSYLLLMAVVIANRCLWGMRVMAVGLALNVAAMAVNGGLMPVTPETLDRAGLSSLAAETDMGHVIPKTKDVLVDRSAVKLYPITDILVTQYPRRLAYSVGDLIIVAGVLIALTEIAILALRRREMLTEQLLA